MLGLHLDKLPDKFFELFLLKLISVLYNSDLLNYLKRFLTEPNLYLPIVFPLDFCANLPNDSSERLNNIEKDPVPPVLLLL